MKKNVSKFFLYKVYKVLCKLFDADAICFGKMHKNDKEEIIFVIHTDGLRTPLLTTSANNFLYDGTPMDWLSCKWWKMAVRKNAKKNDMQKEIVLAIMKALEKGHVGAGIYSAFKGQFHYVVRQGYCFEKKLIEMDLGIAESK